MKEKLIITAALAGGATTKHNNPNTPYTAEEFAEETYRCLQEGLVLRLPMRNEANRERASAWS